jgi:hypothetical protein
MSKVKELIDELSFRDLTKKSVKELFELYDLELNNDPEIDIKINEFVENLPECYHF